VLHIITHYAVQLLGTRGKALLSHADSVIKCLLKCVDLKNKTAAGYAAKVRILVYVSYCEVGVCYRVKLLKTYIDTCTVYRKTVHTVHCRCM